MGAKRKFVRVQRERALRAVDVAFAEPLGAPLVETFRRVSDAWVRRFALGFILIVHGSYRLVVELLRDLFGVSLSVGTIRAAFKVLQGRGLLPRCAATAR